MDQFPKMLYKVGAQLITNDGAFDTAIANDEEHEATLVEGGYFVSMADAKDALKPKEDAGPPTRAELEQKAKELNISFDGRTGDATLAKKIEDALKPKE